MSRRRTYGEGEVRIGRCIELNDDIYSIGFISQLRDDIMVKFLDITTGKLQDQSDSEEETFSELQVVK
jgi:hypothetical protein